MSTLAVVNPVAGGGRVRRLWPRLLPRLWAAFGDLSVRWTTGPGTATALTRAGLRDGAERIVAVGGDGTLHEVANGFFADDGTPLAPEVPCAFVACGTGSDVRRALGAPAGLAAADRLPHAPTRPIDLLRLRYATLSGDVEYRYAVNVASMGLSGAVVRWAQWGRRLAVPPRLRYFGAILAALGTERPAAVRLTLDGRRLPVERAWLVAVANGTTFGAGLRIAPTARPDDGLLDVTVVRDRSPLALLAQAPRFYRGTHASVDGVDQWRGQSLKVRPNQDAPVWLEADGERLGRLPATIEVVPRALRVQA